MLSEGKDIAKYCDAESLRVYPEAIRSLPFCVWKMESVNGRMTKVPYNPKTGFKAAVDKPRTFACLDEALSALQSGTYSGVGVNIAGNVGGIDVDKCVSADGTLSDTAKAVLALFPEAHVEYSPSGHGLHLYFIVPDARTNPHFSSVAVIAMADYYSSISVFGESRKRAADEAVEMAALVIERIEADKPADSIQAAWNFVTGWVASNSAHFVKPETIVMSMYPPKEVSPVYGLIEKGKVYVIASDLNEALSEAGYSYRKCIRGFQRSGFIDTFTDSEGKKRSQVAKVIKGVQTRVYALNLDSVDGEDDTLPFDDPVKPQV